MSDRETHLARAFEQLECAGISKEVREVVEAVVGGAEIFLDAGGYWVSTTVIKSWLTCGECWKFKDHCEANECPADSEADPICFEPIPTDKPCSTCEGSGDDPVGGFNAEYDPPCDDCHGTGKEAL